MIKIDLKGTGWKGVNGITLAQDRDDCYVEHGSKLEGSVK